MSRLASTLGAATLCLALLAATPATARAQYQPPTNSADVTVYGGYDFPTLDLADMADAGPMVGLSAAYRLHEQVNLRLDGNASFYSSTDYPVGVEGPSARIMRVSGGLEVNLFDPKLTKWRFLVNGGAGWAFLSTDDLPESSLITDTEGVSTEGLLLRFGARIGYPVTDRVLVYFGGEGYYHNIAGDDDTENLQRLNIAELGNWKPSWTIPFTLGLRFSLN